MPDLYNIYCDESCHILHDLSKVMSLGAIWCPEAHTREINLQIRDLKTFHGFSPSFEIKWTKVSQARLDFYTSLVDYFFENPYLFFRVLVVLDKSKLRHTDFNQDHDDWYYKMYFDMLKIIFDPADSYNIYLDYKDTRSSNKIRKLHDVLCNNFYDFSRGIIQKVQTIKSDESNILQLADFLIGAVTYANRDLATNEAKLEIINQIRLHSGYKLTSTTLFREKKMNIFLWRAQEEK